MSKLANGVAGVGVVASGGLGTTAFIMWDRWLETQEKAASLLAMGLDKAERCGEISSALKTCMEVVRTCGQ